MASLSTCHLGLWLGWQILLNIVNLPCISKVLENVVASRLMSYIVSNRMSNVLQSAYKQFHSTETEVHNDKRMSMWYGISGTARSRFSTYLKSEYS